MAVGLRRIQEESNYPRESSVQLSNQHDKLVIKGGVSNVIVLSDRSDLTNFTGFVILFPDRR